MRNFAKPPVPLRTRPNSKWWQYFLHPHKARRAVSIHDPGSLRQHSIVAYKTGTQQTVNLVLDTIRLAMKREKKGPLRAHATATSFSTPRKHTST